MIDLCDRENVKKIFTFNILLVAFSAICYTVLPLQQSFLHTHICENGNKK